MGAEGSDAFEDLGVPDRVGSEALPYADAVAAVAIARTVASRYADVGGHTPVQLQPLQTEWYAEWARTLSEYRGERIDSGWPLPETAVHLG